MTDYQSMKVTDLKEKLTALGLPTKGLKKELVERLEEHDQKGAGKEGGTKERDGSEQPVDYMQADEEPEKEKKDEQEEEASLEKEDKKASQEKENGDDRVKNKDGEEKQAGDEPKKRKGESEASQESADPKKQKSLSTDQQEPSSSDPSKDASKGKPVENDSASVEPESNTLYIKGFVRPFTNGAVKDFLSADGEVTFLWMDRIKSYCFVTFQERDAAAKTKERVNGMIWPEVTGKILQVEYFEEEKAQTLSQKSDGLPLIKKGGSQSTPQEASQPKLRTLSDIQKVTDRPKEKEPERVVEPRSDDSKIQVELAPPSKGKTQKSDLDDLFQKTKTKPVLYFLPLTEEQIRAKEERKKQREEERKKREEERKREDEERKDRPRQRSREKEEEKERKKESESDSDREKD